MRLRAEKPWVQPQPFANQKYGKMTQIIWFGRTSERCMICVHLRSFADLFIFVNGYRLLLKLGEKRPTAFGTQSRCHAFEPCADEGQASESIWMRIYPALYRCRGVIGVGYELKFFTAAMEDKVQ